MDPFDRRRLTLPHRRRRGRKEARAAAAAWPVVFALDHLCVVVSGYGEAAGIGWQDALLGRARAPAAGKPTSLGIVC